MSANSPEGRRIVSLVSNDLIYPVIVYAFNNRENNSLNRGSVIHRIEGQVDFETLRNSVMRAIEIKDNMVLTQKTPNQSLTHAELIEQQKEEIAILERMEEEKKKKQKEIEEELELEKKQQMEKLKQIEQKKLEKLNQIPDEPVQGHPDTTVIILRYPDGNRRIERRFLKTDRIKVRILNNFTRSFMISSKV